MSEIEPIGGTACGMGPARMGEGSACGFWAGRHRGVNRGRGWHGLSFCDMFAGQPKRGIECAVLVKCWKVNGFVSKCRLLHGMMEGRGGIWMAEKRQLST